MRASIEQVGQEYAHYPHDARRKIAALQRRAAWLRERVGSDSSLSFDKGELSAIEWALGELARRAA